MARETPDQEVLAWVARSTVSARAHWGVKVSVVEVKDVELPQQMQRALARQAEAERERRAKIIAAEGELQASEKLSQAAAVIASEPTALQLRYLQTLTEISSERTSTLIIPVPLDLFEPFLEARRNKALRDGNSGPPMAG
jgi:regulator of protease activity HflC (stomatin/prohibitin superfamily)